MLSLDRKTILDAVHQLPVEEQMAIAEEILRTAQRREPPCAPNPQEFPAAALRGVAKTAEPLDDARLLDESRMERYGG